MTDARIEKWTRWIEAPIKNDVLTMHLHRATWNRLGEIIDAHGELPPSYFWEYLRETYGPAQAVAVRRQADVHRDAASLGRLVHEVCEDPTRLTPEFWVGLWETTDPVELAFADRQWADNFGGAAGDHLDPAIPAADLERLTTAAAEVKRYVDENVAHSDASPAEVVVTFNDMHDAIDTIGDVFIRYASLLTAAGWALLTPTIQHDWEAIFREPWIRPGAEPGGASTRAHPGGTKPEDGVVDNGGKGGEGEGC